VGGVYTERGRGLYCKREGFILKEGGVYTGRGRGLYSPPLYKRLVLKKWG